MRNFNSGMKAGLLIELLAGIVMALLVLISKPIPDLVAWIFYAGMVIAIASAFVKPKK